MEPVDSQRFCRGFVWAVAMLGIGVNLIVVARTYFRGDSEGRTDAVNQVAVAFLFAFLLLALALVVHHKAVRDLQRFGRRYHRTIALLFLISLFNLAAVFAIDRGLGFVVSPAAPSPYGVAPAFSHSHLDYLEIQYTLRTNDQGIRYRTIPFRKPPTTKRYLILGNSFVEGFGVADTDRWSDRVESFAKAHNRAIEMVNCGVSGAGPVDYLKTMINIGFRYDPDEVLFCIYPNDVSDTPLANSLPASSVVSRLESAVSLNSVFCRLLPTTCTLWQRAQAEQMFYLKPGDLVSEARVEKTQHQINDAHFQRWLKSLPEILIEAADAERFNRWQLTAPLYSPGHFGESLDLSTKSAQERFAVICRALERALNECESRDITFRLVIIPTVFQYDPESSARLSALLFAAVDSPMRKEWLVWRSKLQEELHAWSNAHQVSCLDLCPSLRRAFKAGKRPLNYRFDNHWTPEGHLVAAEAVYSWLTAQQTDTANHKRRTVEAR